MLWREDQDVKVVKNGGNPMQENGGKAKDK